MRTTTRRHYYGYSTAGGLVGAVIGVLMSQREELVLPFAVFGGCLGVCVYGILCIWDNALIRAARSGNLIKVRGLLDKGRNVNGRNQGNDTALIQASFRCHLDVVQELLERGADVNAENDKGYAALALAASNGNLGVVQALLSHGANVNAKTSGKTALTLAKETEIKVLLKQAGAV